MGLTRLAENTTGGFPDFASRWSCLMMGKWRSPVECPSEWVGCGMSFLFAERGGGGREPIGILSLLKQRPSLLMGVDNGGMMWDNGGRDLVFFCLFWLRTCLNPPGAGVRITDIT